MFHNISLFILHYYKHNTSHNINILILVHQFMFNITTLQQPNNTNYINDDTRIEVNIDTVTVFSNNKYVRQNSLKP